MNELYSISWDITYACNSRCLHCYNCSGKSLHNELNKKEMLAVCEQIINTNVMKVDILGGEPILNRNLFEVAKKLKENDITVTMITNGLAINERHIQNIKKYFSTVQISIDGIGEINNKLRNTAMGFERANKTLENLRRNNIDVIISSVITNINYHSIIDILHLARKNGVRKIKLSKYIPSGRGFVHRTMLEPNDIIYDETLQVLDTEKEIEIEVEDPQELFKRDLLPLNLNWMGLTANGFLLPNIFIPFSIGNIKNHSISDYWKRGMKYKKFNVNDLYNEVEKERLLSFKKLFVFDIIDGKKNVIPFTGEING